MGVWLGWEEITTPKDAALKVITEQCGTINVKGHSVEREGDHRTSTFELFYGPCRVVFRFACAPPLTAALGLLGGATYVVELFAKFPLGQGEGALLENSCQQTAARDPNRNEIMSLSVIPV